MKIEFTVPGIPVGKARPKVTMHGTFTPKKTRDYERKILECWSQQSGVRFGERVPLRMKIICYFPVPKSASKKQKSQMLGRPHIKRPDTDNIIKSVSDAIQDKMVKDRKTGVKSVQKNAFEDDSCIYRVEAIKLYSNIPRMYVLIEEEKE